MRSGAKLASAAIAALVSLVARGAFANPSLVVEGETVLDGDHAYAEILVKAGATLHVKPFVALDGGSSGGTLHLRASHIHVESGGRIDAVGSGFPAHDGANGDGPGPGGEGPATDTPGGGGAFGGNGDTGRDATCMPIGGLGGSAYLASMPDSLGSAGGAAKVSSGGPSLGGGGGGRIVLEAALIEIDGVVDASGAEGVAAPNGVASGAGAGGAVEIRATSIVGTGRVLANGGGGQATTRSNGGGGGGGIVHVTAESVAKTLSFSANAGSTGACSIGSQDGPVQVVTELGCLDLDGDGYPSALCGGSDCDDSDTAVHPGLPDVCDGTDNDCDGQVDAPLSKDACPADHTCLAGECRPNPETPPLSVDARPDHLELEGGCRAGGARGTGALGGLLGFLSLLALGARRRRAR